MRLLDPSPGEIMDRVTILNLKIEAAKKQKKDPTRFENEKFDLEIALKEWQLTLKENTAPNCCPGLHVDPYEAKMKAIEFEVGGLQYTNSLLWVAEDRVRELPEAENATQEQILSLAQLCKSIASLNDRRADQVRKISELYGEKEEVHEKIYGAEVG